MCGPHQSTCLGFEKIDAKPGLDRKIGELFASLRRRPNAELNTINNDGSNMKEGNLNPQENKTKWHNNPSDSPS